MIPGIKNAPHTPETTPKPETHHGLTALSHYFRIPDNIHPAVIYGDSEARTQYTWSENTERYIPSGSDAELTETSFYIPPGSHPLSDIRWYELQRD